MQEIMKALMFVEGVVTLHAYYEFKNDKPIEVDDDVHPG